MIDVCTCPATTATDAPNRARATATIRKANERNAQALLPVGTDVNTTAEQVRLLSPTPERVGDFVDTVSRIAASTNLLALTAAIEAPRAGNDGLAFAVAADEIRTFAPCAIRTSGRRYADGLEPAGADPDAATNTGREIHCGVTSTGTNAMSCC